MNVAANPRRRRPSRRDTSKVQERSHGWIAVGILDQGVQDLVYGVRPSRTHSFQDHLGLVRGTKSKIEDGYYTGTTCAGVVAVGDLAGAQPLPVQVVLELSHFLLLSAAVGASLEAMQR